MGENELINRGLEIFKEIGDAIDELPIEVMDFLTKGINHMAENGCLEIATSIDILKSLDSIPDIKTRLKYQKDVMRSIISMHLTLKKEIIRLIYEYTLESLSFDIDLIDEIYKEFEKYTHIIIDSFDNRKDIGSVFILDIIALEEKIFNVGVS